GLGDLPSEFIGKDDGVNRLGSFMGAMGQSDPDMTGGPPQMDDGDLLTAKQYGMRIVGVVEKLRN
ncbi:flavodoxin family protein, partial [filamentous cyanobacterium LEGE 11480]|nr:flavodoxin family protein [Romeriopsis navalis LEGE 11480]